MNTTMRFCVAQDIPCVYKIHPDLRTAAPLEWAQQIEIIDALEREARAVAGRKLVYRSEMSINSLTRHSRFTATLNGGTIMDNFFSTTPVLSCARSMFMATDGLVYEPTNVTR